MFKKCIISCTHDILLPLLQRETSPWSQSSYSKGFQLPVLAISQKEFQELHSIAARNLLERLRIQMFRTDWIGHFREVNESLAGFLQTGLSRALPVWTWRNRWWTQKVSLLWYDEEGSQDWKKLKPVKIPGSENLCATRDILSFVFMHTPAPNSSLQKFSSSQSFWWWNLWNWSCFHLPLKLALHKTHFLPIWLLISLELSFLAPLVRIKSCSVTVFVLAFSDKVLYYPQSCDLYTFFNTFLISSFTLLPQPTCSLPANFPSIISHFI